MQEVVVWYGTVPLGVQEMWTGVAPFWVIRKKGARKAPPDKENPGQPKLLAARRCMRPMLQGGASTGQGELPG